MYTQHTLKYLEKLNREYMSKFGQFFTPLR